jgi:Escherichia/Staphylococcus phage prohead protease
MRQYRGSDPPRVTGYGAVFYNGTPSTEYQLFEDIVERLAPGCFDRTLREDAAEIFCLFNHIDQAILGRVSNGSLVLRTDNTGLYYDVLPPDTSTGRDVVELVRRKDLAGSSFSFMVRASEWKEEGGMTIRTLTDVILREVSPVINPAYVGTSTKIGDGESNSLDTDDGIERRFLPAALCAFGLGSRGAGGPCRSRSFPRPAPQRRDPDLDNFLAGTRARAVHVLQDR